MKNFVKLLVVLLTVCVLCCGIAFAVSAEDDNVTEVKNLDQFWAAWKNASVHEIKLTANITVGANQSMPVLTRDLVLDLNGYTLSADLSNSYTNSTVDFMNVGYAAQNDFKFIIKGPGTVSSPRRLLGINTNSVANGVDVKVVLDGRYGVLNLVNPLANNPLPAESDNNKKRDHLIYLFAQKSGDVTTELVMLGDINFAVNSKFGSGIVNVLGNAQLNIKSANINVTALSDYEATLDATNGDDNVYMPFINVGTANTKTVDEVVVNDSTITTYRIPVFAYAISNANANVNANNTKFVASYNATADKYRHQSAVVAGSTNIFTSTFNNCTFEGGRYAFVGVWQYPPYTGNTAGTVQHGLYVEANNCNFNSETGFALIYYAVHAKINGGSIYNYDNLAFGSNPWTPDAHKGVLFTGAIKTDKAHTANEGYGTGTDYGDRKFYQHTADCDYTNDNTTTDRVFTQISLLSPETHERETVYVLGAPAVTQTAYPVINNFQSKVTISSKTLTGRGAADELITTQDGNVYYHAYNGANAPIATVNNEPNTPYIDISVFGVVDNTTDKQVSDYEFITVDFDIATSSAFPKGVFKSMARGYVIEETMDASGNITRTATRKTMIGTDMTFDSGVLTLGDAEVTLTSDQDYHVTFLYAIEDGNSDNVILYVFVDGAFAGKVDKPFGANVATINKVNAPKSEAQWTDNGDGTKSRTYHDIVFDAIRFSWKADQLDDGSYELTKAGSICIDNLVVTAEKASNSNDYAALIADVNAEPTAFTNLTEYTSPVFCAEYVMPGTVISGGDSGVELPTIYGVINGVNYYDKATFEAAVNTDGAKVELYHDLTGVEITTEIYVVTNGNVFEYTTPSLAVEVEDGVYYFREPLLSIDCYTVTYADGTTVRVAKNSHYDPYNYIPTANGTSNAWYSVSYGDMSSLWDAETFQATGDTTVWFKPSSVTYTANIQNVKYNVATQSYFTFNVYVPTPNLEGLEVDGVTATGTINGANYSLVPSKSQVAAYNDGSVTVTVTLKVGDGDSKVDVTQDFTFSLPVYFEQVLTSTSQNAKSKSVAASAVNYCNELCKLSSTDGKTGNATYESLLSTYASYVVTPSDEHLHSRANALKANDAEYNTIITASTFCFESGSLAPVFAFIYDQDYVSGLGVTAQYGNVASTNKGKMSIYTYVTTNGKNDRDLNRCKVTTINVNGNDVPVMIQDTVGTDNNANTKVQNLCTSDFKCILRYYSETNPNAVDNVVWLYGYYNLESYILSVENNGGDAAMARALLGFSLAVNDHAN